MQIRGLVAAGTVALVALSGCGDDGAEAAGGRVAIATTVAPITSIVSQIVGDRADVTGVVPEGTNSHTFEPRPSVAELLSDADVLYMNGLSLEEPTKQLAEEVGDGDIVELGDETIDEDEYLYDLSFPEDAGKPNPHLWTDPTLVRRYAEVVKDDMSERDPRNAAYYGENYDAFSTLIDAFDAAMRESFATIPEAQRKLLTYHDAYAYFAETYDWEVIGAIQVGDFDDPTPSALGDLIEQVQAAGVPAIFGSEVFPSPVLEQIGREAGVEYVDVLRDDDLPGEPGEDEHSWLGLMRFDFVTMTEALGGDASALRSFELRNVAPDEAEYPQ
jgi:ABC-type Zn uptake system ZnuABC Zn-binding protein ZnuA